MRTRPVEEIIRDLQRLKVTESELKTELKETVQHEVDRITAADPFLLTPAQAKSKISLKPEKLVLKKKTKFQKGDRVYINNLITPAGTVANSKDRKAVVTSANDKRCLITTDNKVKTHRLHKYLLLLVK